MSFATFDVAQEQRARITADDDEAAIRAAADAALDTRVDALESGSGGVTAISGGTP